MAEFDFKKIFKGKKPVCYVRVSSQAQKRRGGGLQSQKSAILKWLKSNGITRKPIWFVETGSAGDESGQRKKFHAMITFILESKDPSQYIIVMRDFKRWSRNVFRSASRFEPLYDAGVELVSITDNISTGSIERKDPDGEFMFGLWTALGSRERTGSSEVIGEGVAYAKEELGVIGGQPIDIEGEFRTLLTHEKDLRDGVAGWAAVGRDRMTWRSPKKWNAETGKYDGNNPRGRSWMVKGLDKYDRIRKYGKENQIKDPVEQWLDVVDMLKGIYDKHGEKSRKYIAVRRMTSGFLKRPTEFWQFKPTDEQINKWLKNPSDYQPSKGR